MFFFFFEFCPLFWIFTGKKEGKKLRGKYSLTSRQNAVKSNCSSLNATANTLQRRYKRPSKTTSPPPPSLPFPPQHRIALRLTLSLKYFLSLSLSLSLKLFLLRLFRVCIKVRLDCVRFVKFQNIEMLFIFMF